MKSVKIFSNGSEFMHWQASNCAQCDKYECESTLRNEAGCVMAYDIDSAYVGSGKVSELTARLIGWRPGSLGKCPRVEIREVFPDFGKMNQLNLFK